MTSDAIYRCRCIRDKQTHNGWCRKMAKLVLIGSHSCRNPISDLILEY
ncbi:Protein of unknown function [Pyronema omphalodes CBS 100304]|uniref:Uncharacterized protein n=1 Tax=Pyronema omphalodes (strain CBS 100304) TaxID=1076935 RepID=U4LBG8_PYROM|nr:Protein of unknown function [Pyronema omphalodes CBS 100304]